MEDSKLLEDARQHQNETDTNGSDQEVKGLRGRTGTNTVSLITQEDFNFEGTTIETADIIIAKCNHYDKAIDGAKLLVAVERGRAYAYAKVTLKTNVAVAARYKTSEKSVKNYITTFNGREILKTEGVPDSTGINKLVGIVNVGKAKARVESMDLDLDLEDYTDAEIIKAAKLSKCDVVDFLEAEVEEDEGEVYVELGTVEEPEPVAVEDETVYTDSETLMAAFKDKELHCLLTYMEHHISPIEFPVGRVEALQMVLVGSSINRYIKNIGNGGVGGFAFAELQRNETENVKATTEAVFARARLKTAKYRITCAALVMYEIEDPEAVIMFAGIAAMLDFKYFEEISASEIADYKNKIKNIVLGMPKIVAGIDTVNDYLGDECVAKIEDDYKMEKAVEEMTAHKKLIDAAIEKNGVPIKKWGASSLEKLLDIKGMAIQKFLRNINTKPLAGTNITKLKKYMEGK